MIGYMARRGFISQSQFGCAVVTRQLLFHRSRSHCERNYPPATLFCWTESRISLFVYELILLLKEAVFFGWGEAGEVWNKLYTTSRNGLEQKSSAARRHQLCLTSSGR